MTEFDANQAASTLSDSGKAWAVVKSNRDCGYGVVRAEQLDHEGTYFGHHLVAVWQSKRLVTDHYPIDLTEPEG